MCLLRGPCLSSVNSGVGGASKGWSRMRPPLRLLLVGHHSSGAISSWIVSSNVRLPSITLSRCTLVRLSRCSRSNSASSSRSVPPRPPVSTRRRGSAGGRRASRAGQTHPQRATEPRACMHFVSLPRSRPGAGNAPHENGPSLRRLSIVTADLNRAFPPATSYLDRCASVWRSSMNRADVTISPFFWRMNLSSHAATNTRARSIVREFTPETYAGT